MDLIMATGERMWMWRGRGGRRGRQLGSEVPVVQVVRGQLKLVKFGQWGWAFHKWGWSETSLPDPRLHLHGFLPHGRGPRLWFCGAACMLELLAIVEAGLHPSSLVKEGLQLPQCLLDLVQVVWPCHHILSITFQPQKGRRGGTGI